MNGCSFQQVLRQNLVWFLSTYWKTLFLRGFILKPTERAQKNGSMDLQNKISVCEIGMFLCDYQWEF